MRRPPSNPQFKRVRNRVPIHFHMSGPHTANASAAAKTKPNASIQIISMLQYQSRVRFLRTPEGHPEER